MKKNRIWHTIRLQILSVFLLLGLSTVIVGTAYGRYQKSVTRELTFSVREAADFQISTGSWTDCSLEEEQEASKRLEVSVRELTDKNCAFHLRLFATLGLEMDQAKVSLIVTNTSGVERVYEAKAEVIGKDTLRYEQFGPGCEYCFYNEDGEELIWYLDGQDMVKKEFMIEIKNGVTDSLIEITAIETQTTE